MKTLYSSTFLSVILGFMLLLARSGTPVVFVEGAEKPVFTTILNHPSKNPKSTDKVHVDVFNGLNCPNCKVFGQGNVKELQKKYGSDPKIDFQFHVVGNKDNPDESLAMKAIQCAEKQGKYWEMVQSVYDLESIEKVKINAMLEPLEWTKDTFKTCLEGDEILTQIDGEKTTMETEEIKTLPSTLVNNRLLVGNQPLENIEREIRRALSQLKIENSRL